MASVCMQSGQHTQDWRTAYFTVAFIIITGRSSNGTPQSLHCYMLHSSWTTGTGRRHAVAQRSLEQAPDLAAADILLPLRLGAGILGRLCQQRLLAFSLPYNLFLHADIDTWILTPSSTRAPKMAVFKVRLS